MCTYVSTCVCACVCACVGKEKMESWHCWFKLYRRREPPPSGVVQFLENEGES